MKNTTNLDCILLESNLGVYPMHQKCPHYDSLVDAPLAIVSNSFIEKEIPFYRYAFACRENLGRDDFFLELTTQVMDCIESINIFFKRKNQHIYLGGDHSVTLISLLNTLVHYGSRVGYVQFDSHGDMNLWQTSPSKNFHGMFLRPFLDRFDIPDVDALIADKMDPSQIMFIGNLELDPEEEDFFVRKKIQNVRKDFLKKSPEKVRRLIHSFLGRFDHLHVSFDIDIFHKDLVSSPTTPSSDGWEELDVFTVLDQFFEHPHCSLDIVEFNPRSAQKEQDQTLRLILKVLDKFKASRNKFDPIRTTKFLQSAALLHKSNH